MKSVIIVAAGSSTRFGENKLNVKIGGKTVLEKSVDVFRGIADEIIVVGDYAFDGVTTVKGGSTRFESVQNGLAAVSPDSEIVAVHDGARPFVSRELAVKLFEECERFGSAVPCLAVTDTVWRNTQGVLSQPKRDDLFTVQTPQVFNTAKLRYAYANADRRYTDESGLYYAVYGEVHFVDGERGNIKITYKEDLPDYRIGAGYDVHAFGEGSGVVLGGTVIPYDKKLVGHSDADVLAHAICDAVLSASGNRDIGCQFPDTDPKYKGANSLKLLETCVMLAKKSGYSVVNVSAVIICQQPKMSPYIGEMSANLAKVLQIEASEVNLSATTAEGLGTIGNGDGIAVTAQALLSHTGA